VLFVSIKAFCTACVLESPPFGVLRFPSGPIAGVQIYFQSQHQTQGYTVYNNSFSKNITSNISQVVSVEPSFWGLPFFSFQGTTQATQYTYFKGDIFREQNNNTQTWGNRYFHIIDS